jgi:S1-C subfamily serine protease
MGVSLSDRGDHVVLSGLAAGGPAERAGLQIGDRLEKLADRQVRSASDVLEVMRGRSPGEKLKVQVQREQRTIEVTVQLEPRPG